MKKILFVFLVPVLLVLYCSTACLANTTSTNLATDQASLLALKSHIITPNSSNILAYNWSIATSCCNWIGVTCGHRHHRVTALNLSDMGLTGIIPPHLGNLSFLALLDMRNNSFHGHLNDQLSFLRRLKVIDLRFNNFSGRIPSWFGIFPQLQTLRLSNNSFSGSIPSSIYNMSSLEFLDLGYNRLSGNLPLDMCSHLPELNRLYLHSNQLYGTIPSALQQCRRLQVLSMSSNKFTGSIPKEIGNLTMLKQLDLDDNNFEGVIPQEMGNLASLKILSIRNGGLTGPIPSAIFNISSMEVMAFTNNNLSGSLPEDIMSYHLKGMYLSYNQLSGLIPNALLNLRELMILSLSVNQFQGSIPREIGNLTSIKELYLGLNNLVGAIPHELGNLHNIEHISLDVNGLSGSIPPMIFNISTLTGFSLADNNLSGELPPSIGIGLPNLKKISFWGNKLNGIIPSSISNASQLTILELQKNSFTGVIPNTLGNLRLLELFNVGYNSLIRESSTPELRFLTSLTNCQYLRHLSISVNYFSGGILPTSIGNFSDSLELLYIYDCYIKGNIPREIGNLKNLILISLEMNQLTGSIPPTIGRLQKLQYLVFSRNKLQGSIPYDICLIRSLGYLHLSDNQFSGPIPACIDNLTHLLKLDLNSNKLMSTIPLALTNLTDILTLNLSSNSLSGNIPFEIGSLKVVTEIDVSMNLFSGNIPSTVGSLQRLVYLSLAHNSFQGSIPPSFEHLVSLELLDLSYNNLSGEIPKSLEELRYLKTLNVSSNRLHGEIPNGGPFINFSAQSFMLNDALCGAPRFQVQPCKTGTPRRSRRRIVVLVLKFGLPPIGITLLVLLVVLIRCRKNNDRLPTQTELLPITLVALKRVSYLEILQATNGFSENNLLGNGSFGYSYRGVLPDGLTVAVKVFNLQLEEAFKSFDVECDVLRNIRHRNLIKIISSCSNGLDFKALVLEYMPNGSLEKWLYSHNYYLDILQRLNIMMEVAFALEYLHHGYSTPIIHCDLKPSNILLDEDMVAHVGDFGISKLLGEGEFMKQTTTLATIGYMAPEYGTQGIVSTKGDVFSYGIMLMETFTGRKPTNEYFTEEMNLKRWVADSIHDSIIDVVDSNLLGRKEEHFVAKEQCLSSILALALKCCADSPEERVNMKDVVLGLVKIKNTLVAPIERA